MPPVSQKNGSLLFFSVSKKTPPAAESEPIPSSCADHRPGALLVVGRRPASSLLSCSRADGPVNRVFDLAWSACARLAVSRDVEAFKVCTTPPCVAFVGLRGVNPPHRAIGGLLAGRPRDVLHAAPPCRPERLPCPVLPRLGSCSAPPPASSLNAVCPPRPSPLKILRVPASRPHELFRS
jgi:hypothetical protein